MPQHLLLLTGSQEASVLIPHLAKQNVDCRVQSVDSLAKLEETISATNGTIRLIAFCTFVIVPKSILDSLSGPSYNIHPGPPSFPGSLPFNWGAYVGVQRFGATLHEMAPQVDEGAIIDVAWFEPPHNAGEIEVTKGALQAAYLLVARWAWALTSEDRPLPHSEDRWSGRKTTRADFEAMCRIRPDIDVAEFERRQRAFAERPGSRMTVTLHGREFHYTTPEKPTPVTNPNGPRSAARQSS
jgi:methionyl-tRNA formyltransferase